MIRVAIAEDQAQSRDLLCSYLKQYMTEKNVKIRIDTFADGAQLLFDYEAVYDALFLDIEMPKMDGMTAAKKVREVDPAVAIIFVTNMAQYAIEGYRVHARSYLLKPVNYYSFSFEMDDIVAASAKKRDDTILIQDPEGLTKVKVMDVLYVEVQKHTVLIHTLSRGVLQIRSTMKAMEEQLSGFDFFRTDASYLVNLAHVSGVGDDSVSAGSEKVPVSRRRRREFLAAFAAYMG